MRIVPIIYQRWHKSWSIIRSSNFSTAVFLIVFVLTIGSLGISIFELGRSEQFRSLGSSLWWSIVTTTTVGYGDKVPVTIGGKIFGAVLMLAGIASFSLFTASVSSMLVARKIREDRGLEEIKSRNHILICGWSHNGETILNSFLSHSTFIRNSDVVLVNNLDENTVNDLKYRYKQLSLKFVRGDFTSESVLVRAGVKNAASAVVLPDLSSPTRTIADEKTVLATLSIKSIAPRVRVFAHVLEKEGESHLKRAHVTDIIVSDEFSGFLLMAHVLFPGIPQVVSDILKYDSAHVIKRLEIPAEFEGKPFKELSAYFKVNGNHIVIALVKEAESVDISDVLQGDYSFLDEFIERKFREAGRGVLGDSHIRLNVNPDNDYIIRDEKYVVSISDVI